MMKGLIYCLAMVLGLVGSVYAVKDNTYHTSTSSGHLCTKCEPGTYWVNDCEHEGQQANCSSCPSGTYQPNFNIAHSCALCQTECPGNNNQEVPRMVPIANCTTKTNMICGCTADHWMETGPNPVCRRVSACPPGKGVLKLADQKNNTTCEPCRLGSTYSNISSKTEACQNCSVCGPDQVVQQACNAENDTICVSRDQQQGLPIVGYWEIVGMVVGAIVIAALVVTIGVLIYCKRRKSTWLKALCARGNECTDGSSQGTDEESPMNPQWPGLLRDNSLMRIAGHIGMNWKSTGLLLGLSTATLDQITIDHRPIKEAIWRMLMRWRDDQLDKNPRPSFEEMKDCLVQALNDHEGTLAYQLKQLNIEDTYPD